MLDALIRFSLRQRLLTLSGALLLLVAGAYVARRQPVDVLPDLTAPTVTVVTEAQGLAPEEIELLVTFPLESALNGAPDVRRVRSVSAAGISVIWVEFGWGRDIYKARQVVTERLQAVELPASIERPQLGPVSSIMGEITFIALTSKTVSAIDLRRIAETVVRRRLLAIPGIAQVVPIGGDEREYRIEVEPTALARHRVSLTELRTALAETSQSAAAGFHVDHGQEYLVRGLGRARTVDDIAATPVRLTDGVPLTVGQLADVRVAPAPKRGTASYNARPAVILSVQKQAAANTLELTRRIDEIIDDLAATLPTGVVIEKENFRQAAFIEVAIHNVTVALRDGAVLVVVVLLLFLGNLRATLISALAIPLSLAAGVLVLALAGQSINTMTLGGLTIAIGALVDDAIIYVENALRRLREEQERPEGERRKALAVVQRSSSEVIGAILFATLIIVLVFLPLLVLPGIEGRLLRPLGLAYVAALSASLLVSVTITPVLCTLLLTNPRSLAQRESWLLRQSQRLYQPLLDSALAHRRTVLGLTAVLVAAAVALVPFLGRSFLPPFNEGAMTIAVVSPPDIPLSESDAIGRAVESALLAFPEVVSTSRRTGRAERDEHVQGVNASEMEVVLRRGRPKEELLAAMRAAVASIPGAAVTFGQPISHRIDHVISGSKSNLAVKVKGPELAVLRSLASQAESELRRYPRIVDLSNQEQASVPQLVVEFDRPRMARFGLRAEPLARSLEALFQGTAVSEVFEDGVISRVVLVFPAALRADRDRLADLPVTTPEGDLIRLGDVARVRFDLGPSLIRRENVERTAMLTANIRGTDLTGAVEEVRAGLARAIDLPAGYTIEYGGQFEEAERGLHNIALLSVAVIAAMGGLLFVAFGDHRPALIVLINLPLALIGGIFAVALGSGVVSVASLVGFITLFGIATRNGVLLMSRYQQIRAAGAASRREIVRQGSRERLAPVLMTAITAGLALIPLVVAGAEPGNEIQSPMAQVILGGLISSTFLNLVVVPVLYERFGEREER